MGVMRKFYSRIKYFLIFVTAAFILFVFLQWGMQTARTLRVSMLQRGIVAKVNNRNVPTQAYTQIFNRYGQRRIDPQSAFRQLVHEVLLEEISAKRAFVFSDEEILNIIRNNPPAELLNDTAFQTEEGFNYARYYAILNNPANIGWLVQYCLLYTSPSPRD